MNSVCEDIKDMLVENEELAFSFGTNLFISQAPPEPIDVTTIYDTSSSPSTNLLIGDAIYNESIQVMVRSSSYSTGYELAMKIKDYLPTLYGTIINGSRYILIQHISGPTQLSGQIAAIQIGKKRGWIELSLNFNLKRTKS